MAEQDISLKPGTAPEIYPTDPEWTATVLKDFELFLQDHASCEKKASGMALNVASHYPDQPQLLTAMVDLAVEELNHYREVVKILLARNLIPGADQKDPYIGKLNQEIRRGSANFLLDRLLVGAVVERRGAERFGLIAQAVDDPELKAFYTSITESEDRHWVLFVDLAKTHCDVEAVAPRLAELSDIEGQIVAELPLRPALH